MLEILSLMAKEVAKELTSETVTRNREKTCRERVHLQFELQRTVSVKEQGQVVN